MEIIANVDGDFSALKFRHILRDENSTNDEKLTLFYGIYAKNNAENASGIENACK